MSKRILKFALTTIGTAMLIICIVNEIDGIGRGFLTLSGTLAIYISCFIK